MESTTQSPALSFETSPDQYRHWMLTIDGAVATLAMDVREDAGLRPNDYKLKLNSYDLGVDIELADALQRLRFEHPEVHAVYSRDGGVEAVHTPSVCSPHEEDNHDRRHHEGVQRR